METNRLRQFLTIATTGNLRRAAEILSISHSALSKSIKVLEQELKTTLLQPSGRGIELTREGNELARRIPAVLENIEALRVSKTTPKPVYRIVTFEVFSTYFMGPLSRELNATLGEEHRLQCLEAIPGEIEEQIVNERAEVGITYLPIARAGLRFQKVTSAAMGVFVKQGSFARVPVTDLPFVVPLRPIQGTPSDVKGLDGWPDHLFPRQIRYEVDLMETAIQLCREGSSAVFLPRFIARLHNQQTERHFHLEERPLPRGFREVERDVFVVLPTGQNEGRFEKILSRTLRIVCRHTELAH